MPTINDKAMVDKAVSILSGLYKNVLKQHNLKGNVDFSGLSEHILLAIQQGQTGMIESIINGFVDEKIRNYDKVAGDLAAKADKLTNHRRAMDDLIGFSKTWNKQCATAITSAILSKEKQTSKDDSKASKTETLGPKENTSIEEAGQRNAQILYEKTGKVPEGYNLSDAGQVIKDKDMMSEEGKSQNDGMEL